MLLRVPKSSARLRVNQIFCLGVNYNEHASEMNVAPPKWPLFFLKSTSSLIRDGESIVIPPQSSNVHHEVELAVIIGKGGKNITSARAFDHVLGYAVFNDVTARDLQEKAKEKGLPWTLCKGFDTFGPISDVALKEDIPDPHDLSLKLWVNGELKQSSNTSRLIFKIPHVIEYLSSVITLNKGDIIATGTPSGVSAIKAGDVVVAEIERVGKLTNPVRDHH